MSDSYIVTLCTDGEAVDDDEHARGAADLQTSAMPGLVGELGSLRGRVVALDATSVVLGRRGDCDLVLDRRRDVLVSARHARVYQTAGRWWVEDLGSRNGTWIDGAPIRAARALEDGTRVVLGQERGGGEAAFRFVARLPAAATEDAEAGPRRSSDGARSVHGDPEGAGVGLFSRFRQGCQRYFERRRIEESLRELEGEAEVHDAALRSALRELGQSVERRVAEAQSVMGSAGAESREARDPGAEPFAVDRAGRRGAGWECPALDSIRQARAEMFAVDERLADLDDEAAATTGRRADLREGHERRVASLSDAATEARAEAARGAAALTEADDAVRAAVEPRLRDLDGHAAAVSAFTEAERADPSDDVEDRLRELAELVFAASRAAREPIPDIGRLRDERVARRCRRDEATRALERADDEVERETDAFRTSDHELAQALVTLAARRAAEVATRRRVEALLPAWLEELGREYLETGGDAIGVGAAWRRATDVAARRDRWREELTLLRARHEELDSGR